MQADVQRDLAGHIAKARAAGRGVNQGAVIVMTTTGRIVAMGSYPDYNPNIWTNGISRSEFNALFGASGGEPAINWAVQGQYAPGSTWKVTTAAAAVADGYSINGSYGCPASVSIGNRNFLNDGEPDLGQMSLSEALIQSCDTVFYDLAYSMWQRDNQPADYQANPHAPTQKMAQMELDWGFGQPTGIDLPDESLGSVPTRQWVYDLWKANAHTGQNWCKYGNANGSYVQQIEYEDCTAGYEWLPGQAVISSIGQGYVSVTPLQLAQRLRGAGQRRDALQPADRRGAHLTHRGGGPADQPARHPPPACLLLHARLHPRRAGGGGDPGHRRRRVLRLPAEQGLRGWQDGHRRGAGPAAQLGVRVVRTLQPPSVRGRLYDPQQRIRCRLLRAAGPADLRRHLRPRRPPCGDARRPGAIVAAAGLLQWADHRSEGVRGMSLGRSGSYGRVAPRGTPSGPRVGAFRTRPRSVLTRVTSRDSFLRHLDWVLVAAVLALCVLGVLLVWSATGPSLAASGASTRTYLDKQAVYVVLGLVLMAAVSLIDYRQLRVYAPVIYGVATLGLLAVLTPLGSTVNGARGWIDLPAGFQIEPSEYAKIALILMTAMLFSELREGAREPGRRASGSAAAGRGHRDRVRAAADRPGHHRAGPRHLDGPGGGAGRADPAVRRPDALGARPGRGGGRRGDRRAQPAPAQGVPAHPADRVPAPVVERGGRRLQRHPGQDRDRVRRACSARACSTVSRCPAATSPAQSTDFIFTVAGQELGFVGAVVIVALLGVVVVRALRIATRADDQFGMLVAAGIAIWFLFQSFVNIGMTVGIMPITGLPLPFISYGGSAIFADMIAIGLLLSVHRKRPGLRVAGPGHARTAGALGRPRGGARLHRPLRAGARYAGGNIRGAVTLRKGVFTLRSVAELRVLLWPRAFGGGTVVRGR